MLENEPALQFAQLVDEIAAGTVDMVPAMQFVHDADFEPDQVPTGQVKQNEEDEDPTRDDQVPALQSVHPEEPEDDQEPGPQAKQVREEVA